MGYPSYYECIAERLQSTTDELGLGHIPSSPPCRSVIEYRWVGGSLVKVQVKQTNNQKKPIFLRSRR